MRSVAPVSSMPSEYTSCLKQSDQIILKWPIRKKNNIKLTPANNIKEHQRFGRPEGVTDEAVEIETFTEHPDVGGAARVQPQEGQDLTAILELRTC